MFVHLLTPRVGAPIELSRINVILGGNQSGKTTLLQDIFRLATGRDPGGDSESTQAAETQLLDDLQYGGTSEDQQLLSGQGSPFDNASSVFEGLAGDLQGVARATIRSESWNIIKRPVLHAKSVLDSELPDVMLQRLVYLDASNVHRAIQSTQARSPLDAPADLLQVLQYAPSETHAELDAAFAAMFPPQGVRLDDSQRIRLTLRVAEAFPDANDGERAAENAADEATAWSRLASIEQAGRGARYATALTLAVLLLPRRIVIVDELDAALQPFAARQLGRWLANAVAEQDAQLIFAAHSESIVAGLLERSSEVTLLHTARRSGETRIGAVAPETIREFQKSPSLVLGASLAGIHRQGVILVTGPLEAAVMETLNQHRGGGDRWQVQCAHGLAHAATLLKLLRECGVPSVVVTAFTALSDKSQYTTLLRAACKGDPPMSWTATRDQLARHMQSNGEGATKHTVEMEQMLEKLNQGVMPDGDELASDTLDESDPWVRVAKDGMGAVPTDQRPWVEQLIEELKSAGIFLLPHDAMRNINGRNLQSVRKAIRTGQAPDRLAVLFSELSQYLKNPTQPAAADVATS